MSFRHLFDSYVLLVVMVAGVSALIPASALAAGRAAMERSRRHFFRMISTCGVSGFAGSVVGYLLGASATSLGAAVVTGVFGVFSGFIAYLFGRERTDDAVTVGCAAVAFLFSLLLMSSAARLHAQTFSRDEFCRDFAIEHLHDCDRMNLMQARCGFDALARRACDSN